MKNVPFMLGAAVGIGLVYLMKRPRRKMNDNKNNSKNLKDNSKTN